MPSGKQISDIPRKDEVGERLVAAAREIAKTWGSDAMRQEIKENLRRAVSQGRYVEAKLRE